MLFHLLVLLSVWKLKSILLDPWLWEIFFHWWLWLHCGRIAWGSSLVHWGLLTITIWIGGKPSILVALARESDFCVKRACRIQGRQEPKHPLNFHWRTALKFYIVAANPFPLVPLCSGNVEYFDMKRFSVLAAIVEKWQVALNPAPAQKASWVVVPGLNSSCQTLAC